LIFSENYGIIIVKSKDDSIVKKGVAVESIEMDCNLQSIIGDEFKGSRDLGVV
jgi:hypothetical protein